MNNHHHSNDGEAKALHARQVTECRQLDSSTPKPPQKWDPWKLLNQAEEWVQLHRTVPGIHNSNGRGREGRINRCGNSVVRYTLIETAWRMTRWQPDYPPIKKLRRLLSKRARRRLVVAAARRLAIDLWRLTTGRASAQELGLQLQPTMTQKPSVQRQKK